MSGGSMDYFYGRVEDCAMSLAANTPQRKAFRALLFDVSKALKDIEWVDSGDCSPGDENEAIEACLAFSGAQAYLQDTIKELEQTVKWLKSKTKEA